MFRNKKALILWTIAILVILGVIVVGFYIFASIRNIRALKPYHALHPERAPSLTYGTYTSEEFGFTLDYPMDGRLSERRSEGFSGEINLFTFKYGDKNRVILIAQVTPGIERGGIRRALYESLKDPGTRLLSIFQRLYVYVAPLRVAGTTAYVGVGIGPGASFRKDELFSKDVEIVHNGKLYTFLFSTKVGDTLKEDVGIIDRIINSLRFVDSSQK